MQKDNIKLLLWEFEQLTEAVNTNQFKKINVSKLENFFLNTLPKYPDIAADLLPKIDTLSIQLTRGLNKISISEKSVRDDILCCIVLLNAILGKEKKVAELISDVQAKKIDGINNDFVINKLYNYMEKGGKLAHSNKIWSKLLHSYNRGEKTAIKGQSEKVKSMLTQEKKKGRLQRIKDFLGI